MVDHELIQNGRFETGDIGALPREWTLHSPRPVLTPFFQLTETQGKRALLIRGNGQENCVGHVKTSIPLEGGSTYRLAARFRISPHLNPQTHLLFAVYSPTKNANGVTTSFNEGIMRFERVGPLEGTGEVVFTFPGTGSHQGEVRIYFRQSAQGSAWIDEVSLQQCEPLPPRLVKLACGCGTAGVAEWENVLETAGQKGADLVLLPETLNNHDMSLHDPFMSIMAKHAMRHQMYVAGGVYRDQPQGAQNLAVLFDRTGQPVGEYQKIHPYTPELFNDGIVPGRDTPVFNTDFGKVGFMICYDSWFTDVAELLALKGAEVILFPSAGYYRALMPARAADNGVRIIASALGKDCGPGMWDTAGREAMAPLGEPTCYANHPPVFTDVHLEEIGKLQLMTATLDLSASPSPHNWGGPMLSAPGGRRNRREQHQLLHPQIAQHLQRWWEETSAEISPAAPPEKIAV